jgi:signal peptidase I
VLLVAMAALLWPQGAGGSTTYLVTRGASMKPGFSSGDLAIVRRSDSYRVGDVAAYRSLTLRRVVLHRIVAASGSTYTFKGDANSFRDPEQVRRTDVVGKLSVRVPKLGSVLLWLSSPFNALLLAMFVTLAVSDRERLFAAFRSSPRQKPVDVAPAPATPALATQPTAPQLEGERVVGIRDLRFPYELAVADVVDEAALLRLAEHYDRPILYDEAGGLLFVVESNMLFRCQLAVGVAPSLSVVPLFASEDEPEPAPLVADEPVAPPPDTLEPVWSEYDQAWIFWQPEWSEADGQWFSRLLIWSDGQHSWVDPEAAEQPEAATELEPIRMPRPAPGRMTPRRRVPSPHGRDWGYDDEPDEAPRSWLRWVR